MCLTVVLLWVAGFAAAQPVKLEGKVDPRAADQSSQPNALTLSSQGKCDYSVDGVTFVKLDRAHIFEQGAVVRTGSNGRIDLFFRRTGTTVRLQSDTEIKLEAMSVTMREGVPVVHTLLDLHAGRIFTVVRSAVPGSTLEIRNAAGRAVVEGSGIGRYIITADGTHVAAQGSALPLKVIGETGITIVSAGQQFSQKDGKMLPLSASPLVKDMIELDAMEASAEAAAAETRPPKP